MFELRHTGLLAFALLILPLSASGESTAPWVPVDCVDRLTEVTEARKAAGFENPATLWRDHNRRVRHAQPGDPLYVPHPFPKSTDAVVADFLHAYFNRLFDDPLRVPAGELSTYGALRDEEIRFEVVRVENWRSLRCSTHRAIPYYFLVRLIDPAGGEVGRGVLHPTGVFSQYAKPSEALGWYELDELDRRLQRDLGAELEVTDPQYVTADGAPLPCRPASPCIAFRSGGSRYLLVKDELLYELPSGAAALSVHEWTNLVEARGGLVQPDLEQPWLSVGFGWTRGRLVADKPDTNR